MIERFHLIEDSKVLEANVHVEDPGAFTTSWDAIQRFRQYEAAVRKVPIERLAQLQSAPEGPLSESICAAAMKLRLSEIGVIALALLCTAAGPRAAMIIAYSPGQDITTPDGTSVFAPVGVGRGGDAVGLRIPPVPGVVLLALRMAARPLLPRLTSKLHGWNTRGSACRHYTVSCRLHR